MNIEAVKSLWLLCVVGWAIFTDVRYHKIKNYTVVAGIAGGLSLNIADIKPALIGLLIPFALVVFFAFSLIGAGDVKLLCAAGSIICFPDIVQLILFSFVFCGIHILIHVARQHGVRDLFRDIWIDFKLFVLTRRVNREFGTRKRLPMAGSIAAAALLIILRRVFEI